MFIAALFVTARTWEQPKCPSRGMGKEDVVHIYNGMLLSHKKNGIMPFVATWMDPEIIILSKVNQKDTTGISYMWNLKYDTKEPIYETGTDSET